MSYVICSIARILVVKLDPAVLHMFGIPDDFLKQQKLMETDSLNKKVITDAEMSPAFRKLCFVTVVKWSNSVSSSPATVRRACKLCTARFYSPTSVLHTQL